MYTILKPRFFVVLHGKKLYLPSMTNTTPTDLNKHSVRTVIWKVLKKKHLLGEFVSEPSRNDNQKKEALNC